jgi:hypothetical protein
MTPKTAITVPRQRLIFAPPDAAYRAASPDVIRPNPARTTPSPTNIAPIAHSDIQTGRVTRGWHSAVTRRGIRGQHVQQLSSLGPP